MFQAVPAPYEVIGVHAGRDRAHAREDPRDELGAVRGAGRGPGRHRHLRHPVHLAVQRELDPEPAARAGDGARLLLQPLPGHAAREEGRHAHPHATPAPTSSTRSTTRATSSSSTGCCPRRATRWCSSTKYEHEFAENPTLRPDVPDRATRTTAPTRSSCGTGARTAASTSARSSSSAPTTTTSRAAGLGPRRDARRGDRHGALHHGPQRADRDAAPPADRHDAEPRMSERGRALRRARSHAPAVPRRPRRRHARRRAHARGQARSSSPGATGFVGKVALSMLLDRYPEVGKVFVLVRPGTGGTAEARFFDKVAPSRPFDPLRARHGDALRRASCARSASRSPATCPIRSSASPRRTSRALGRARRGRQLRRARGLRPLARARARRERRTARATRSSSAAAPAPALLHVSTCFVAGNRDGVVYEDEELVGYFPRREGVEGRPRRARSTRPTSTSRPSSPTARAGSRRCASAPTTACSTSRLPRARARAAPRRGPRRRRREGAAARDRPRAQLWLSEQLVERRHGARAPLGLAEHVHVHEVARRAGHRRRSGRAPGRSSGRRSSRARCASRSRAGTRASPPARRSRSWRSRATAASPRPRRRSSTSSRWTSSRPA